MSLRYNNFTKKLEEFGMEMVTLEAEFLETKKLSFRCSLGHVTTMIAGSFINKTAPKNTSKIHSLCTECEYIYQKNKEATELTDKLGFCFLRLERHPNNKDCINVYYRCLCGNESCTDIRNLKKPGRQSQCHKCQNHVHKVDYSLLMQHFEEKGCVLLTPPEAYKNNKQKLDFRCVCGNESEIVYHDLMRGRLCSTCKIDRTKTTSLEKYGVDNPSKSEEVKKKIVETTLKNHGVMYAQQSPEIRAKTDATSLQRYGKLRAFLLPEVFEKIRKTHKAKYGVEFPLQAKEIQDKISMTFLRTLGATRPFLSETFLQKMKEKYGHEWFCCTEAFKNIMMEKYGSEHYVTSDHCKQQMMEKYGSEFFITSKKYREVMMEKYGAESAMQCPELFRRAQQSSSFCRKAYVTPDGKTYMVLGYEGCAMDDILKEEGIKTMYAGEDPEIPVFQYVGEDDKTHFYYPDIYIPEENRVVEVKSVYTYNRDPEKTLCKALKVSENYLFELRLYNDKKEIVEILECRNGMFYSRALGLLKLGDHY